jgi:hypothetical protein
MNECFFCQEPCEALCDLCNEIGFCSKSHLKLHKTTNKSGSPSCLPYKIVRSAGKGKTVVATRDIKPFELILYDSTSAYGPFEKEITGTYLCLVCMEGLAQDNNVNPQNCCQICLLPLCQKPSCQSLDSIHSQRECQLFRTLNKNIENEEQVRKSLYRLIAPIRAMMTKTHDPELWGLIRQLETHYETRKAIVPLLRENEVKSLELIGLGSKEDICLLEELICAIKTNSLSFERVHGISMGSALFPLFSLLNHSCMSNCRYSPHFDVQQQRVHVEIRAKEFVPKGAELTIQYTSSLQANCVRTQKLVKNWLFTCDCARCNDNPTEFDTFLSGVKCQCSGYLLYHLQDKAWICSDEACGRTESDDDVRDLLRGVEAKTETYSLFSPPEDWILHLNEALQLLHPNNYLVMNIKRILAQVFKLPFNALN